jgi:hypothetical protein
VTIPLNDAASGVFTLDGSGKESQQLVAIAVQ